MYNRCTAPIIPVPSQPCVCQVKQRCRRDAGAKVIPIRLARRQCFVIGPIDYTKARFRRLHCYTAHQAQQGFTASSWKAPCVSYAVGENLHTQVQWRCKEYARKLCKRPCHCVEIMFFSHYNCAKAEVDSDFKTPMCVIHCPLSLMLYSVAAENNPSKSLHRFNY